MKLYVWEYVFEDHTYGMAAVLARDAFDARRLLLKALPDWATSRRKEIEEKEPREVTGPEAIYVFGGG